MSVRDEREKKITKMDIQEELLKDTTITREIRRRLQVFFLRVSQSQERKPFDARLVCNTITLEQNEAIADILRVFKGHTFKDPQYEFSNQRICTDQLTQVLDSLEEK